MFNFLVEYETPNGTMTAKFTNEKHAKVFIRNWKKESGVAKLYSLNSEGKKDKELKVR